MQSFLVVYREYPTSDLIILCIHTRLKVRVYTKKKSSHSWDITPYTTRKHCITSMYVADKTVG